MSRRAVFAMIREDDFKYDPFGTSVAWHFAVADALTEWAPPYPPAKWEYRQGLGGIDRDDPQYQELNALLEAGELTADDLLFIGNVLHRFEQACERGGDSY